ESGTASPENLPSGFQFISIPMEDGGDIRSRIELELKEYAINGKVNASSRIIT
ncbi:hypothetical protein ACTXT7_005816, partial [Hymenolepis weldensis]